MTGEERGSQNWDKKNVNAGEKFVSAGTLTYTIAGYPKSGFRVPAPPACSRFRGTACRASRFCLPGKNRQAFV